MILVLLTIASITMMGAINLGGAQQRTRTQNMLPYHVQLRRGNIVNILRNQGNWNATAGDSSNSSTMACVTNAYVACPGSAQPINAIRTAADTGTNVTYKVGGTNGITATGETCTDYPSETCPISFSVSWQCTTNCTAYVAPPPPALPSPPTRTYTISVTPLYNPDPAHTGKSRTMVAFDVSKYIIPSAPAADVVGGMIINAADEYFHKP